MKTLSQEKIAKLENVNQSTISRYLRESINKLKKEFKICNLKDEDYIDNDTYTKSQYVRWSLGFIEISPKWAVQNNDDIPDRARPSELDLDSQMKSNNKLLFDTYKMLVNVSICIY